jgi:hypothetical protein
MIVVVVVFKRLAVSLDLLIQLGDLSGDSLAREDARLTCVAMERTSRRSRQRFRHRVSKLPARSCGSPPITPAGSPYDMVDVAAKV